MQAEKVRRRRPKAKELEDAGAGAPFGKAIGRALRILDLFPPDGGALTFLELREVSGLPDASLFRILGALASYGYLERLEDGAYRPGGKLLFGRLQVRAEQYARAMKPYLETLAAKLDETVSLGFLFRDLIRVIDTIETTQDFRMTNTLGRVVPPHASSLGKAITAFQEPAKLEAILRCYGIYARTSHTITDRNTLAEEFRQILQNGHAFDRQETVLGGQCCAVPIRNGRGAVEAAVSVSVPLNRITKERQEEILRILKETADGASTAIAQADRMAATGVQEDPSESE